MEIINVICHLGEIEQRIVVQTSCAPSPTENICVKAQAILCRCSDICPIRNVELGRPDEHWQLVLHSRHCVVESF